MVKTSTLIIGAGLVALFFSIGGASRFASAKANFARVRAGGKELNDILKEKAEGKAKNEGEEEKNNG